MEPPSPYTVDVLNQSGRRVPTAGIKKAVATVFKQHAAPPARVCVLLAEDEVMRNLNRDFRRIDEVTDVLTFPAELESIRKTSRRDLGDIAIAVPYAAVQADSRGVTLQIELAYLAIHGALHLMGFDDETESERSAMQAAMNRAGIEAGLPPDAEWVSILREAGAAS